MKHLPKQALNAQSDEKDNPAADKLMRAIDRRKEKIGSLNLGNFQDSLQGKPKEKK